MKKICLLLLVFLSSILYGSSYKINAEYIHHYVDYGDYYYLSVKDKKYGYIRIKTRRFSYSKTSKYIYGYCTSYNGNEFYDCSLYTRRYQN